MLAPPAQCPTHWLQGCLRPQVLEIVHKSGRVNWDPLSLSHWHRHFKENGDQEVRYEFS
jgi:hypothetical protein